MILGIFGLYLKSIGQSQTSIGFLEGLFEAISLFMKLLSGLLSDVFRNRKGLILVGYGLLVLSPPTIAASSSVLGSIIGRALNRLGNGIQSTPRDALVGDVAPKTMRGQCFGLKRSMGTFGSLSGGLIAFIAMHYFHFDFKEVFALALIPAIIGLLIIVFQVKNIQTDTEKKDDRRKFKISDIRELGTDYAWVMLIAAVFYLSRLEESFMPLYANLHLGLPKSEAPIIMVIYNITYSLSSYPIGILADRTNRIAFMGVGIFALILSDFCFFAATSMAEFWVGVILWGIQMGITMNTFTSIIVDITPKHLHGTAFGCYYLVYALVAIIANSYAGLVSEKLGNQYAYLLSGIIASLSLIILVLVMKYRKISAKH